MRFPWHRSRQTIVVDFGDGSVRIAATESSGEAVRFHGITEIAVPRERDGAGAPDLPALASRIGDEVRQRGWLGMPTACLLSGAATSTQSFRFPPMPESELRQAIELKLGQVIHFDLDDACFDFRQIHEAGAGGRTQSLVLVALARKDAIQGALGVLRQAGLNPVAVGAASESLANLSYIAGSCQEDGASVHVHIGTDSTILNLLEGRLLRFSREIDTGSEAFTRALMRPIITGSGTVRLTRQQAEEVQAVAGYPWQDESSRLPHGIRPADILPLVEPLAQRLCTEIRRSIDYLEDSIAHAVVDRVVLSGPGALMRRLDTFLEDELETPVTCIDPVERAQAHWRLALCDEVPTSLAGFAAILGYALGEHRPINLTPPEERVTEILTRVSRVRRAVAPSVLMIAIALGLSAIPIHQNYNTANELLQVIARDLEFQVHRRAIFDQRLEEKTQIAQLVETARGGVPDWVGLMKELSFVLPEGSGITDFSAQWEQGVPVVDLAVQLDGDAEPAEDVLFELMEVLSTSPFFQEVHLQEASLADEGPGGYIDVRLEIVARPPEDVEDREMMWLRRDFIQGVAWVSGLALVTGLLIGGSMERLRTSKQRVTALQREIETLRASLKHAPMPLHAPPRLREVETALAEWQEMASNDALCVAALSSAAQTAGVTLVSLQSLEPETEYGRIVSSSHELQGVGRYRQVAQFLDGIYASRGMAAINTLEIEPEESAAPDLLRASLRVTWHAPRQAAAAETEDQVSG